MSHHNHKHTQPLQRKKPHSHGAVPANVFGALTGKFDHWTLNAHDGSRKDDNHIFVWLNVNGATTTGKFEAAVNVESSKAVGDASAEKKELRYYLHDETVPVAEWPAEGFSADAELDYRSLGLHESDFTVVTSGALRTLVASDALHAQLISIYGMTYSDGTGIHDVHLNQPNKDGAMIFYFDENNGGPKARWVFLKFETPVLA